MSDLIPRHHRIQIIVILTALAMIWGSSFILMKRALIVLSPLEIAALRMMLASVILLPLTLRAFRRVNRAMWGWIIVQGLLGAALPAVLFVSAQQYTPSAITGMLNSLTPIVALIVAALVFGVHPTTRQAQGIFIGFVGALLLIGGDFILRTFFHSSVQGGPFQLSWYSGLIVVATICYGLSVNLSRQKFMGISPIDLSVISYIVFGIIGALYTWQSGVPARLSGHPDGFRIAGYLFILGGIGSGIASLMFNHLIQISNVLIASSVTYLIPIVAIMWGIADGEVLTPSNLLGIGIILVGVYLVNVPKQSPSISDSSTQSS